MIISLWGDLDDQTKIPTGSLWFYGVNNQGEIGLVELHFSDFLRQPFS